MTPGAISGEGVPGRGMPERGFDGGVCVCDEAGLQYRG